jgi:hypothetical protein
MIHSNNLYSNYSYILMYIGPWQEYKLAQVIRVKNDLYEGRLRKQSAESENSPQGTSISIQRSHISTPSTRSFSSEPVQKPYPKFNLDTYYQQWQRVETLISRPENAPKKPPLPPQPLVRKRQGKSIQERRVNKMRLIYGIENKAVEKNETSNASPRVNYAERLKNEVKNSGRIVGTMEVEEKKEENSKKGFSEKLREEVKKSENFKEEAKKSENFREEAKKSENFREEAKKIENFREEAKKIEIFREDAKKSEKIEEIRYRDKGSMKDKEKENNGDEEGKAESKFSSLKPVEEKDIIEESLNQDHLDGLLKWVDELPDELSSSPQVPRKGLIL